MNTMNKLPEGDDPYAPGELVSDESFAKRATPESERAFEEALGMQPISIRMHKKLLEELKFIAKVNGIGYQPLIRDVLQRFITGEVKAILRDAEARHEREERERAEMERNFLTNAEPQRRAAAA